MTVSFTSIWDTEPSLGGWHLEQNQSTDRLSVDGVITTPDGRAAVKCFVQDGDNFAGTGTQRSEVAILRPSGVDLNETTSSGLQYIATSVRIPTGWNGVQTAGDPNAWSLIIQLHGPDSLSTPPALALACASQVAAGPKQYFLTRFGGDVLVNSSVKHQFSSNAVDFDNWTQFVFRIFFAGDTTGSIKVWRRDVSSGGPLSPVLNVTGVETMQFTTGQSVGAHYWKQGLYRGPSAVGTSQYHFGPFVRASTMMEAVSSAFGQELQFTPPTFYSRR